MEKIENPKVFISYAWGTEDYQEKVLSFASELLATGVDVELDRWSLKEGHDSYAFMEQSVNDPTITNVIILLDPVYAEKANNRTGGVGTETQIISPEIYNKTKQEKFIPVIFGRDENGEVRKPSFLRGLLHFDLSLEENYDSEFERLVKRLYGREAIKKPELGAKPAWVDQVRVIKTKVRISYDILKANQPERVKKESFITFLTEIKSQIIEYNDKSQDHTEYLFHYEQMQAIRDQYLLLLKYYVYVEDGAKLIAEFFEEAISELSQHRSIFDNLEKLLLHELFIYTIAYFYKQKDHSSLSRLFCKTYFTGEYGKQEGQSFVIFCAVYSNFDNAVRRRDNKAYHSGTAEWWIEHVNTDICNKDDLVFADLLCFNASLIIWNLDRDWFPITYVYGDEDNIKIRTLAYKLRSRENLDEICIVFGFNKREDFAVRMKQLESDSARRKIRSYGFTQCFSSASFIGFYIKADDLGTNR